MLHRALQQPLGSSWRCIALSAATRLPLMLMHPYAYTSCVPLLPLQFGCQGQNDPADALDPTSSSPLLPTREDGERWESCPKGLLAV